VLTGPHWTALSVRPVVCAEPAVDRPVQHNRAGELRYDTIEEFNMDSKAE